MTSKAFHEQMKIISESGIQVLSMPDALKKLNTGEAKNGQFICITFDDGYMDNLTVAWPILKKFNYPVHIFIVSGWIGTTRTIENKTPQKQADMIDEQALKRFLDEGGTIGSHSVSHSNMLNIDRNTISKELHESKTVLEKIAGEHMVTTFAYPYAFFTPSMQKQLTEAGYDYAFTIELGPVTKIKEDKKFQIPRTVVGTDETLSIFKLKIEGGYDWSRIYSTLKRITRRWVW